LQKDYGSTFGHSFDRDSTCSYLVLKLNSDNKLLNHQIEIISQNPNPAFVPFHIRREDENTSIYYNITSKISLSQYLERKSLNKKELLDLLKNITKNLILHANYLLNLSSYLIDADFIYINPATAEVSLVYVPAALDRDTMEIYIDFLKNLIVNSASIDDSLQDNYLQRILNNLKSETFSLNEFSRLIIDLRSSGELYECRERTGSGEPADAPDTSISKSPKGKSCEYTGKNENIRNIVLSQLFVLITAAIACLLILSRGMGDITSLAGVLLIAAALDVLVMKRIAVRKAENSAMKDKQQGADLKRRDSPGEGRYKEASTAPDVLKAYDTIMISEAFKDNHPYLESVGNNRLIKVIINKEKFIIGRLTNMVDYVVQGNTVGKLHAEISIKEGGYYIRDLNSKNGTYVNDKRIPSNTELEIKSNDRIRFSNFEYVFRQQEVQ
jgi:hypothetical protein